jgi:phosphoribosyl-ATP pyrophosphohydrolase/phosphoribosyl-AMP cyclohydrolase
MSMDVKWDEKGLCPAIVVDAATGEVLTLAYMNQESLAKTEESGETWFFSRSRNQLWHKGETSGHTQKVVSMAADCDRDAIVVRVIPSGPACHNGTRTCFSGPSGGALALLDDTLQKRDRERPAGSHTTRLLEDQNLRIKKLGEECAELISALLSGSSERATEEAADLVYHITVALRARGISIADLQRELLKRAR